MTDQELQYEPYEYGTRYHIHTAKNSITSLVQIFGEIVSNADEAITKRASVMHTPDIGEIHVYYDPESHRLRVTDDGVGMQSYADMRRRLLRIGFESVEGARRGFFHRGLREVFIAYGGGEVHTIALVGDVLRYSAAHLSRTGMAPLAEDLAVTTESRAVIGGENTGTATIMSLAHIAARTPKHVTFGEMSRQLEECVQIRPVLADPNRHVFLHYGSEPARRIRFNYEEGTPLIDHAQVKIGGLEAEIWLSAASSPITSSASKQRRRSGILIRGERAAYEVSDGDRLRGHPGMKMVFGELRMDGIDSLQREAEKSDEEADLIFKPDRGGLNPDHPLVEAIYQFIDEKIAPLLADLNEAPAKTQVRPDVRRQLLKVAQLINRVINEQKVGSLAAPDGEPRKNVQERDDDLQQTGEPTPEHGASPDAEPNGRPEPARCLSGPLEFEHRHIRIESGETRKVALWVDTELIPVGTELSVTSASAAVVRGVSLAPGTVPDADPDGIATVKVTIVAGAGEGRRVVEVRSGEFTATLPVHVRVQRASGFITTITPVDKDWPSGSALWDPKTGVVSVYVGRPEFKFAEKRAAKAKLEPMKDPQYWQLVIESVREEALLKAAKQRAEEEMDELPPGEQNPDRFHELVISHFQELDYRLRGALLEAYGSQ